MTTRNEYIEGLKNQLDKWNEDIAKWEAKAKVAKTDLHIDYEMQLEALRRQREQAKEKLHALQSSAGEAWKEMKVGADAAWQSMREAVEKAGSHFQK